MRTSARSSTGFAASARRTASGDQRQLRVLRGARQGSRRSPALRSPLRSTPSPRRADPEGACPAPCPPGTGDAQGAGPDPRRLHERQGAPYRRPAQGARRRDLLRRLWQHERANRMAGECPLREPCLGQLFSNPRPRLGQARHLSEPVPQGHGGDTGACPLHRRGFADGVYEAKGRVEGRVLFLVDEAARLGFMSGLSRARDASRKYGITLVLIYQSEGQLVEQWGEAGRGAWFESATWRSYSAVSDAAQAERISKACGEYGIVTRSKADGFWHQPAPAPPDRHQEPQRKRDPRREPSAPHHRRRDPARHAHRRSDRLPTGPKTTPLRPRDLFPTARHGICGRREPVFAGNPGAARRDAPEKGRR